MKTFCKWLAENGLNESISINEVTPEMEQNFKDYVAGHVSKVRKYVKELYDLGLISEDLAKRIRDTHDESKLQEPEYTPYVKRKWIERNSNVDFYEKMDDEVKNAIVHHVTHNAHHPEYWSNDYHGFETSDPCHVNDMPEKYVIEMICDWEAMAEERGNTARGWYNKTKDTRWIFDDSTNKLIDKWLKVFEKQQDESKQ